MQIRIAQRQSMAEPRRFFVPTLELLEAVFRQLEVMVPAPTRKPWGNSFVFRHAEQTIQQAIVQKLARTISGLHAVRLLVDSGLFQEQGMLQRGLDEIEEDIWFLSLGVIHNDITPVHIEYLKYFYAEEFENPDDLVSSHVSRGMVRREKIRAYRLQAAGSDAARAKAIGKVLTKAYSGFVHAASPHIMDMCGGAPGRFDVSGAAKIWRDAEQERDALNYFYRGLLAMAVATKAFGAEDLFSKTRGAADELYAAMQR